MLLYNLLFVLILADLLFIFKSCKNYNLYDKYAWYYKWQYWTFATLYLVFPVFVLFTIFMIQMLCKLASHLKVSGSTIYNTPYSWILCMIVPIVGWVMFIVMFIYINVFSIIKSVRK